MTTDGLKQLLIHSLSIDPDVPDLFHLDISSGWDTSVVQLASSFFPAKKFSFRLANNQTINELDRLIDKSIDNISFPVKGVHYPFNDLDLTVTTSLSLGIPVLTISAAKQNPKLSEHFPVFVNSLTDKLSIDSMNMMLSSVPVINPRWESQLRMDVTIGLDTIMRGLSELLLGIPSAKMKLRGYTWFENEGSLFYGIGLFSNNNLLTKTIGDFNIAINYFGIIDESIYNSIDNVYVSVPSLVINGSISVTDNNGKVHPIPIGVDIYNFDSDIHFKADLKDAFAFGETALENFLGLATGDLKKNLPSVDINKAFQFNEFGFYYNPKLKSITRSYGKFSFSSSFDIINDFPQTGQILSASIKAIQFNYAKYGTNKNLELDVIGEIPVGNGVVEVQLSLIKDVQSGNGFRVFGKQMPGNDIELSKILEKFTGNAIKLPEISVQALELNWEYINSVHSWSFDIDLGGDFPIPFDNPVLTIEEVEFGITKNLTGYEFILGGIFEVGSVEIIVSSTYKNQGPNKGWYFEGSTGPEREIPFGKLIERLWDDLMPGTEHKLPAAISSLVAKNIHIILDTTQDSGFAFTAAFEISESKTLKENEVVNREADSVPLLPYSDPHIDLQNIKISLERTSSIKFLADATFTLGEALFEAKAEYNDGWDFDASMKGTITLTEIIGMFAPKTKLPEQLKGFSFADLHIAFSTKNKNKHFSGRGDLTIEGTKRISLFLKFDVVDTGNNDPQTEFSGHLEVIPDLTKDEKYFFDLLFEKNNSNEILLAAYHKENIDDAIDIGKIIEGFGVEGVPSMQIKLKDAFFVHEEKGTDKLNLMVADIGATMDLSNLPLVGKILPANLSMLVALRALYNSSSYLWGVEEVESINKALPAGISKITIPTNTAGFNLLCELRLGEQIFNLDLPVQLNKTNQVENKPQGSTATNPTSASSVPLNQPVPVSDGITWFKIGKQFGPIIFNQVGLTYKDSKLFVYIDAGLNAGGLTFTLNGLSVSSSITEFNPEFNLMGLGLDFKKGPLEIGGSFLRRQVKIGDKTIEEYDGLAIIGTENFSISALGSYAYYDDHPSLFIFGYLNAVLGGPAFFFVEGLAAAFGYNRSLIMPSVDSVSKFPLVRQVMEGNDPTATTDHAVMLTQQLESLSQYIPPSPGQMFLAAGVRFNSFKLIDSFILLAISFGNRFEIDVIGQSNIIVPSEIPPGVSPLAEIKIQLLAKFLPDEGFLGVMAQLTPDSYILSRNCHLTGGAAFYSWFKGQNKGDFVVTMGGYHPSFIIPSHYPSVPRLGLNWQISNSMSVKGDMYFALCPHAFMAGGHLEALYNDDPLQAWFKAGVDFLIGWQPYHYDAKLYLDIGASYTYHFFGTHHITVDVGADVHIWGPEFAGKATVHIWIFDVDIAFGPQTSSLAQPISWPEFKNKCLPEPGKTISTAITKGKHSEENKIAVVNAKELMITINSGIPIKSVRKIPVAGNSFGAAPMAVTDVTKSDLSVVILKDTNEITNGTGKFKIDVTKQNVPIAIWGKEFSPSLNIKEKTIELVTGITIAANEPTKAKNGSEYKFDEKRSGDSYIAGAFPAIKKIDPSPISAGGILNDLELKTIKTVLLQ